MKNFQTFKLSFRPLIAILFGWFFFSACTEENITDTKISEEDLEWLVETRDAPCNDTEYCNASNSGDIHYFDRVINIDGCEIHVKYRVEICNNGLFDGDFIIFKDIEIKYKHSIACTNLVPYYMVGQEQQYNEALNVLYKKVLEEIEEDFMNSIYPTGTKYAVQYKSANCFKWCVTVENDPIFGELFNLSKIKCGSGCCKRITKYVRGYGNVWIKGETHVSGDPLCIYDVVPEECIKEGITPDICNQACAGF